MRGGTCGWVSRGGDIATAKDRASCAGKTCRKVRTSRIAAAEWRRWWRSVAAWSAGGFPGGAGGLSIGTILILGADRLCDRHRSGHADRRLPTSSRASSRGSSRRSPQPPSKTRRVAEGRDRPIRQPHPRLDRSRPGRTSSPRQATAPIAPRCWCCTSRQTHANCGGQRDGGDGTVLLPGRQEHLSRYLVLPA